MPRVAIYTEEERKQRQYQAVLKYRKNHKDKVREFGKKQREREDYHNRELLRMHKNYAETKEFNRLKRLGGLCI